MREKSYCKLDQSWRRSIRFVSCCRPRSFQQIWLIRHVYCCGFSEHSANRAVCVEYTYEILWQWASQSASEVQLQISRFYGSVHYKRCPITDSESATNRITIFESNISTYLRAVFSTNASANSAPCSCTNECALSYSYWGAVERPYSIADKLLP